MTQTTPEMMVKRIPASEVTVGTHVRGMHRFFVVTRITPVGDDLIRIEQDSDDTVYASMTLRPDSIVTVR